MLQFSDKGYIAKTQNEFYEEGYKAYKGIDPEFRLEPSTPDGLKLAIDSELHANLDEGIQNCYDSRDPNKAVGYDLDVLCLLAGVERKQGTESTVIIKVSGEADTIILQGELFDSGEDTPQFKTIEQKTIPNEGTVSIQAVCTEKGAIEASANTITRSPNVILGVSAITNPSAAIVGNNPESDEELRARRTKVVSKIGTAQMDSITSLIYDIDEVLSVKAFENQDRTTNARGMQGNSIAYIVNGGDSEKIAKAIFIKRSVGVQTLHIGDGEKVTENVFDLYPENARDINFSRPEMVDMVVSLTVKRDSNLPDDSISKIKNYIILYATGKEINGRIYKEDGYKIGEVVAVSQINVPIGLALAEYGSSYIESLTINSKQAGQVVSIGEYQQSLFTAENIGIIFS